MKREILDRLLRLQAEKVPVALVTELDTGFQSLVTETGVHGAFGLDETVLDTVRGRLRRDETGSVEAAPDTPLFVHVFNPPVRLILIGAVHIAQALVPMAALAGYAVTVVDPRRAFATDARFPSVEILTEWPDEALERLKPDARTAVVTLTHDPKLDDPALAVALRSPTFYIGALGSRRTHAKRLERLAKMGLTQEDCARIHGPVGLAIGAVTPAEIAVSILAQVTQARRQRTPASPAKPST